jgi:hypothetical protein
MKATLSIFALTLVIAACNDGGDGNFPRRGGSGDPNAPGAGGDGTGDPGGTAGGTCDPGRDYLDPDKKSMTQDRAGTNVGVDRGRVKPFSALATEFPRVLGNTPASLAASETTFDSPEPRWYVEPSASSVGLQTAYSVAYDGCIAYASGDPTMAKAPDQTSATTACTAMARKFWSRIATPEEIQACVDVATTTTPPESNVARQWAYACATLLTSANFLTY